MDCIILEKVIYLMLISVIVIVLDEFLPIIVIIIEFLCYKYSIFVHNI